MNRRLVARIPRPAWRSAPWLFAASLSLVSCVDHHDSREQPQYDLADLGELGDGPLELGPPPDGSMCGNGVAEVGERCDGGDLAGETCQSLGFDGGTLACAPGCGGFVTDACQGTACDDPFEPNDTFTSAALLTTPGPHAGAICPSGDEDFFAFSAGEGTTLQVRLELVHAQGDLDLDLLDPLGNVAASSTSTSDLERIELVVPPGRGGTWRARVYGWDGASNDYALTVGAGGQCGPGDFDCLDGNCVPAAWACDGVFDCPSGADEAPANPQCNAMCNPGEFACRNGQCIPGPWACDAVVDCTDGSDEAPANPECNAGCDDDSFTCFDGSCIPANWFCDGVPDCIDQSDEAPFNPNCTPFCEPGLFGCFDGFCIPLTATCDGRPDCLSGEDEAPLNPSCRGNEDCGNGLDDDGDGFVDCDDFDCQGSPVCPGFEQCGNALDDDFDGLIDCEDGDCMGSPVCACGPGLFTCVDGNCIPAFAVCDGRPDCPSGSDEAPLNPECPQGGCEVDLGTAVGPAVAVGSTFNSDNSANGSCSGGAGPDVAHRWLASQSGCWRISTTGSDFDTVLTVYGDCDLRLEQGCDDDGGAGSTSSLDVQVSAGQQLAILVDGWGANSAGNYVLNIEPCNVASELACNNGLDDDGDGRADCADPDCAMHPQCNGCGPGRFTCADGSCIPNNQLCNGVLNCPSGEDEAPSNPMCLGGEVCGNGIDDDADGLVDCADTECAGAPGCAPLGWNCPPAWFADGFCDCGCGVQDPDCPNATSVVCEFCNEPGSCDTSGQGCPGQIDPSRNWTCVGAQPELCSNGLDDDLDGRADCADPDCFGTPDCAGGEICDNGLDDNGDGRVDCQDLACQAHPACQMCIPDGQQSFDPAQCCNGDPDGNLICGDQGGLCLGIGELCDPSQPIGQCCLDPCKDGAPLGFPGNGFCCIGDGFDYFNQPPPANDPYVCCNGDPNNDGVCGGAAGVEDCQNGFDDDGDGLVDCADSSCSGHPACVQPENCSNGVDDDLDGRVDCLDPDCFGNPACVQPENCTNGVDDDLDGRADCLDPDCAMNPACVQLENCVDGLDNDGDGRVDCLDPDCAAAPECLAPTCPEIELGQATGAQVHQGSTVGASGNVNGSCAGGAGPDLTHRWVAPSGGCWRFATAGSSYDTVLTIYTSCGLAPNQELGCDDDGGPGTASQVDLILGGGQEVIVVVDGFGTNHAGNYVLGITSCTPLSENCTNGVDDDGDGAIDCADADCAMDPVCGGCAPGDFQCADGLCLPGFVVCNGVFDCPDGSDEAPVNPACPPLFEICDDMFDNDGDGRIDCGDPDCAGDPACAASEICNNGTDDDGDGRIDCVDFDCQGTPACVETQCSNLADDDRDGLVDCVDPDCQGQPGCIETRCGDAIDNDRDGQVDCADPDCAADPNCASPPQWTCPSQWFGDGFCDCGCGVQDRDCPNATSAVCQFCNEPGSCDTSGQGCPGQIDPNRNWTCVGAPPPPGEDCQNGIDDDGNGAVDCMDPGCAMDPACTGGLSCPGDDTFEENDEPFQAAFLNTTPAFEQAILCSGDEDWFAVPATAGETLNVQIAFFNASGNLDLELWDATTGQVVATSASTTSDVENVIATASVNTIFGIRVFGPGVVANEYTLDVVKF